MSEGDFTHVTPHRPEKRTPTDVDESTDTWDTVEWLLAHVPNHNGRVGIYGISYAGFFTAAGIIDTHPAIKAASPQAPVADLFLGDDWYHGGAFMLAHAFNSARVYQPQSGPTRRRRSRSRSTGARRTATSSSCAPGPSASSRQDSAGNPTWQELMEHSTYDDFWQARAIWPHLENIRCPGAHRRRLVRRRRPLRGRCASTTRSRAEPERRDHPRHGPVDARRLGAR